MSFEPRAVAVPLTQDQASNWTGWRELMIDHIKLAETADHLFQIVALNQESFADCCVRGRNSYALICEAIDRRREQIARGLPWSGQ